jgi:hypothetical protein
MRTKPIRRRIPPPRSPIQRLRHRPIEHHEGIVRTTNLHLRLRRRTRLSLLSCAIRIPHIRLPAWILNTNPDPVVRRVDRSGPIVLHRIGNRRIHQPPVPSANHDDQVRSLSPHHPLKPSPVQQRRLHVTLGNAVCLRIFWINARRGSITTATVCACRM